MCRGGVDLVLRLALRAIIEQVSGIGVQLERHQESGCMRDVFLIVCVSGKYFIIL